MTQLHEVPFGDPRILSGDQYQYQALPIDERLIALGRSGLEGVIDTTDDYPAPQVEPLCYPGRTPETSFTLGVESRILPVAAIDDPATGRLRFFMATESGAIDMDDALENAGLTPMAERIPVITFGSNANPGQLEKKFSKLDDDKDSYFIPTTKAVIHDLVPVYVPKVGMWKYSFAAMYPEQGVRTEVAVNWLTPAQLTHMHSTEKAYTFSEFGTAILAGTRLKIPAYLYAGVDSVYLDDIGKPVRLAESSTEGSTLRAANQTDMQAELFAQTKETLLREYPHLLSEGLQNDLHGMIDSMCDHGFKKVDIGKVMAAELTRQNRVADISLLDAIPTKDQNVTPKKLKTIVDSKT